MPERRRLHGPQVRVVLLNRDPWFVAADVVSLLGLATYADGSPNVTHATRVLNTTEKLLLRRTTPHLMSGSVEKLFAFRQPSLLSVSESGLYKLIMRSRKPEAKKFQNWVTQVVLPAIRKDGMYVRGEEKVSAGEMDLEELTLITLTD
nr:Bro-N domain-containing protein [Brucella ceti]